jgi:arylsulfatase A-like enzyme
MLRRFLDSPWLYFGLAGLVLVVGIATQIRVDIPRRPTGGVDDLAHLRERDDLDVVFIVIDTLRADRLSSYGYERPTSPIMDQVARHGVRFDRVISQSSYTKTSMASLWTSTYPVTNGILRWNHALPAAAELPAETLRRHGYETVGIYRNGWLAEKFGFGQGFDTYLMPSFGPDPERFHRVAPGPKSLIGTDEGVTASAQEFLRSAGDRKFFLYLHYMDVHQYAYDADSAQFGPSYSDAYDSAIRWVDRNVGAVLKTLEEAQLLGRTLVVIASDHGEGFGEHGLEGHGRSLYREVTQVPLVLAPPFALAEGIVVRDTVQNVDIWPTIFDLLGIDDGLPGAEGESLLPQIEAAARGEPSPDPDRPAFAELDRSWGKPKAAPRPIASVTTDGQRLIAPLDPQGQRELFDHHLDPWEQQDRLAAEPEEAAALWQQIQGYMARPPAAWGSPDDVAIDELDLSALRALGYVVR